MKQARDYNAIVEYENKGWFYIIEMYSDGLNYMFYYKDSKGIIDNALSINVLNHIQNTYDVAQKELLELILPSKPITRDVEEKITQSNHGSTITVKELIDIIKEIK